MIAEDAIMDTDEDAEDAAEVLETIGDLKTELFDEAEALVPATGYDYEIVIIDTRWT